MPELCRFYNIVIKMIYADNGQHNKPHFMYTMGNMRRLWE